MRVKELDRTVNVAWSPAAQHPVLLAAGTAAQQLDASFSTNAALEIYALNLNEPGPDMELRSVTPSDHRFHKVAWGSYGFGGEHGQGVIVGGCDGGRIQMYSAAKLLAGEDGVMARQDKHTGSVRALDFNPFQCNLLATGASDSEIYIWDLNNTATPMTPGAKSQPGEDVLWISWNRQVQHILASTFPQRCVVWDLRKNEPIIKLSDSTSRIRWKVVAWHPEVATQLCLASEEDQSPVIQLWDLRFATSPLKVLENHQRGVLSIAWCSQDPDLLLSCGKDNRILCWNPNSDVPGGEVVCDVATSNQWNFDVSWCPRNPALIASSSFDGHVSIYSLMGGQTQVQTSNKIADSFPGMDAYAQAPASQQQQVSVDLRKPPKWLRRPVGASFAFGGKLVTFDNDPSSRCVYMSQVVTEHDLITRSDLLETALQYGQFTEFCDSKMATSASRHDKFMWSCLKANFSPDPRTELLSLLGFKEDELNNKLNRFIGRPANARTPDVDNLADRVAGLRRDDGDGDGSSAFDAIAACNQLTPEKKPVQPFKIKTGDDVDGLICQSLLLGNIEAAVELCLQDDRMADAIILAMTGGSDLLAKTQYRYFQKTQGYLSSLISAVVTEDWNQVIRSCEVESWKEALAAALTHTKNEELPALCELLGQRLESEGRGPLSLNAQLCYMCAGNLNKLVDSWTAAVKPTTPGKLQELVELVMVLRKAVEQQGRSVEVSGKLADLLSRYAALLASQGSLNAALSYLGNSEEEQIALLRDRLYRTLGHLPAYQQQQPKTSISGRGSIRQTKNFYQEQPQQPAFNNQGNYPGMPQPSQTPGGFVRRPSYGMSQQPAVQAQPPPSASPYPPVTPPMAQGGSTSSSRSKYKVDPSVAANTGISSFPGSQTSNPYSPTMPGQQQPNIYNQGSVPSQPMSNPYAPSPTSNQTQSTPYAPNPQLNSYAPGPLLVNPQFNAPFGSGSSGNQPQMSPYGSSQPSLYQPQQPGNFPIQDQVYNPPEMARSAGPPQSAPNVPASHAPPGWNDPPMVKNAARNQKAEYTPPNPITHPLYAGVAPEPPNMMGGPPTQNYEQQGYPSNGGYPDQSYNQMPVNSMLQQQHHQPAPPSPAKVVEPPRPKQPIPEEHMYLQTVFDELRNRCTCAANNPQSKRKLEDVARKLEALYDALRENRLSGNTLQGLHQMVQMCQIGDYTGGLGLHTQLVSGPDFSQIASFMPGLKVLLQSALQLGVYLQ